MNIHEVMAKIAYKPGVIAPVMTDEDDAPRKAPRIEVQVVKYEQNGLRVLVEEGARALPSGVPLMLEVRDGKWLYRITGRLERVISRSELGDIIELAVDDFEERRQTEEDQFLVSFQGSFVPMREGERAADVEGRSRGWGMVTKLSPEALWFETEYNLPVGLRALFEMHLPNGRLTLHVKIVDSLQSENGLHTYEMKFGRMDGVTSQRLHRLILTLERKQRRSERLAATGQDLESPRRIGARDRLRSSPSARLAYRERRRRDR